MKPWLDLEEWQKDTVIRGLTRAVQDALRCDVGKQDFDRIATIVWEQIQLERAGAPRQPESVTH